ncbi:LysR family transcriptional regulator [Verticiella sediminum]|uniref:LysR family transcriptional regulator n=1 Tax=Verticiella sediminum TaxID=1247510 RepID=A0A556AVW8_9BURK|nr:LysR family transcriptional regulator [Verticiella sediminum]TSH97102.1 LysR family transcriptional regulator [Verticiella sediminum]
MDKLRELQCFVSVVESGSFVRAADLVGVSTTAVSRAVLGLEARLHARLLHRSTRRVCLTEAGRHYFERCKPILHALQEADDMLTGGGDAMHGRLRVGAPQSFGVLELAEAWPQFLQRHPGVELDILLSDQVSDLLAERLDMAIRIAHLQQPALVHRRLAQTRLVACASPAYLARHGVPRHPEDLAGHAVIAYRYYAGRDEWSFQDASGRHLVRIRPRMRANNGDTCIAAARAGLGVILQPSFLVAAALARGELVPVLEGYATARIGIYAVYPSHRHMPARVNALVEFLIDRFSHAPWAAECRRDEPISLETCS